MDGEPEAPTNVRIEFTDGTEQALPVEYRGYSDGTGLHVWAAQLTFETPGVVRALRCDTLAAHTELVLEIAEPHGEITL